MIANNRTQALVEKHKIFYEVQPYYILLDERPVGRRATRKKIQAGFDINLYASEPETLMLKGDGNEEFRATLKDLQLVAREVVSQANNLAEIEITPFGNSVILDTHHNLRPEVFLRIRITHHRGLDQPEGPIEEDALAQIRQRLQQVGVPDSERGV